MSILICSGQQFGPCGYALQYISSGYKYSFLILDFEEEKKTILLDIKIVWPLYEIKNKKFMI